MTTVPELKSKLASTQIRLAEVHAQNSRVESEMKELRSRLEVTEKKLEDCRELHVQKDSNIKTLTREIEVTRGLVQQLKDDRDRFVQQILDLQKTVSGSVW
eukprot:TRINITY_DN1307_c0_g1_i1.p1 TRINITY_DN1307_c0_g1~~TRINITY_DN1307_c0_g1_i1.p1  ORF type:complete len:101 (-),score=6.47 TRINITY_DN1307_c0_g1_i1:232-534(-)